MFIIVRVENNAGSEYTLLGFSFFCYGNCVLRHLIYRACVRYGGGAAAAVDTAEVTFMYGRAKEDERFPFLVK